MPLDAPLAALSDLIMLPLLIYISIKLVPSEVRLCACVSYVMCVCELCYVYVLVCAACTCVYVLVCGCVGVRAHACVRTHVCLRAHVCSRSWALQHSKPV
jgi:hypothetical protein